MSEKFEPYSHDEAWEESERIKKMHEAGLSYNEAEKSIEKEKEINNEGDFHKWLEEEAKDATDFIEYYKKVQHNFLDLLLEKKNMGSSNVNQLLIRKETYKIAEKEDMIFVKFIDECFSILAEYQKRVDLLGLRDKQKRNELSEEYSVKIENFLEEYKKEKGDYRVLERINALWEKLQPFSDLNGEFVPKMDKLNEMHVSIENAINYPLLGPLNSALIKVESREKQKLYSISSTFKGSINEKKKELERLFGKSIL